MICGSERPKIRLAKVEGAEPCVEIVVNKFQNMKYFDDLEIKSLKNPQLRNMFGSSTSKKCEKATCFNDLEIKSLKNF